MTPETNMTPEESPETKALPGETREDYLAKQVGRHLKPGGIQTFFLYRWEDVSGVSGTGVVAEGVRFGNGKCAVRKWSGSTCTGGRPDCSGWAAS
jgi:hypothetical protein